MKKSYSITIIVLVIMIVMSITLLGIPSAQSTRKIRIASLYYAVDTAKYESFKQSWQYNTECTLGLEQHVQEFLNVFAIDFSIDRIELNRSSFELTQSVLDEYDLILIGGFSYWWSRASSEARLAVFETSAPIICSAAYGNSTNSDLTPIITGISRTNASRLFISSNSTTIIQFTEQAPKYLDGLSYYSNGGLIINTNSTNAAKVYANTEVNHYPLLVSNGTKNFVINTLTYRDFYFKTVPVRWPCLLLVALNEILNIVPNNVVIAEISLYNNVFFVAVNGTILIFHIQLIFPFFLTCLIGALVFIHLKNLRNKRNQSTGIYFGYLVEKTAESLRTILSITLILLLLLFSVFGQSGFQVLIGQCLLTLCVAVLIAKQTTRSLPST